MVNDIYSKGSIIADEQFAPFNRYIDVNGLRMFVLDKVKDEFVLDVANTFEAMFPQSSDTIDLASQQLILQSTKDYNIFQRIGYIGPPENGEPASAPLSGDWEFAQDYIWETPSSSTASQIGEVVEHLLHTISSLSLKYTFPEKWDWDDTSSDVYLAMQEAIDKGIYNVSSYSSLKSDPEGYNKIIVQEFVYWFVSAEWDYFEVMGLSVNGSWEGGSNEEWSLLTSQEVEEQLPLAHKLYVESFSKLVQKPNVSKVTEWFSTDSSVADSIEDDISSNTGSKANTLNKQTYDNSNQTIETIEKSGKWYIDSLLNNSLGKPKKWVSDPDLTLEYSVNNSTVISYSFPGLGTTTPLYSYEDDRGEISAIPFSSAQADDIRQAFKEISKFVNITFVEIEEDGSSAGTIRLAMNTITDEAGNYREGIAATADPPSEEPRGGDVFFNKQFTSGNFSTGLVQNSETGVGDVTVLYHEIFHALGMEHPVDNKETLFQESKNSREYTVMADEFSSENGADFNLNGNNYKVASTPMVYDIAPLQYLYGANMSHNASDTTYSYKPDTPFIEAIWDAGGTDTLDFSNFSKANTISLVDGEYSTIGFDVDWSMTDNLGIAFDAIIEDAIGGSGDDTIKGNDSSNSIEGGPGNDVIDGGKGNDTAVYKGLSSEFIIKNNDDGTISVEDLAISELNEGSDSLTNIEYMKFSDKTISSISLKYALSETIDISKNILKSYSDDTQSGTQNYNSGNNIIIADGQAKTLRGLDGDDTYFISNLLPENSSITIIDTSGVNTIQVPVNTAVKKSQWANDTVRLTFEDSRVVTVNNADKFSYNLGGNVSDGTAGTDLSFSELGDLFGISDILNMSGSALGTEVDMYIV